MSDPASRRAALIAAAGLLLLVGATWEPPRGVHIDDVTGPSMVAQALRRQATHDTLTGLPNRALLNDRLRRALRLLHHPDGPRRRPFAPRERRAGRGTTARRAERGRHA